MSEAAGAPVDTIVERLSGYAADLRFEDLTPAALHSAKRCVLDALGCALSSFHEQPVAGLRRIAARLQSQQPATLIGTGMRTSPDLAALVNGTMIRYSDFSDDYFGTDTSPAKGDLGPHPSDNVGGVLAAAESAGASGRELLLGIVLAYEVCGQFVDTAVMKMNGWDHPPLHSAATALAGGRLLGLTRGRLAQALRLAIVPNICVFETRVGELSQWKGIAGPNGSRNGLFAALLAEEGITGPARAFEGPRGFVRQVGTPFQLGVFGGGDRAFRIEDTYFKSLPIRYELQTPVELALALHDEYDATRVAAIRVFMDRRSLFTRAEDPSLWNPQTRETADHSGPYLIGAALVDGAIDHATFTEARFCSADILSVVDRIEMIPDPELAAQFPWKMACRIEVTDHDGSVRTFTSDNPRGHPQKPMSDDDLLAKFHRQAAPLLDPERRQRLVDWVFTLETHERIDELFALLKID